MKFFEKKLLKLSDSERNLMGMLIAEARRCIATPLDDPYTEKMEKKDAAWRKNNQGMGTVEMILIIVEIYICKRYVY